MSWPLRLIENPADANGHIDHKRLRVGDVFFIDEPEEVLRKYHLTEHYWRDNARNRKPLYVALPIKWHDGSTGVQLLLVDGQCYDGQRGYYDGWTVTGTPPQISVHPSINMVGHYHGFIQNGVITDDYDGRKFA